MILWKDKNLWEDWSKKKKENIQINDIIYEKSNITIVKTGLKDNKIKIDKYLEILSFHVAVFAIKDNWEKMSKRMLSTTLCQQIWSLSRNKFLPKLKKKIDILNSL